MHGSSYNDSLRVLGTQFVRFPVQSGKSCIFESTPTDLDKSIHKPFVVQVKDEQGNYLGSAQPDIKALLLTVYH